MGDPISQANLAITALMQDSGGSHKSNPSTEFKFWSNNFDGLKFLYDHQNLTEDVEKGKTIGAQQLTQNIGAYLMRCAIMTWGLFEVNDTYEKNETCLKKESLSWRITLKVQTEKMEDLNKQLAEMKKQKEVADWVAWNIPEHITKIQQSLHQTLLIPEER